MPTGEFNSVGEIIDNASETYIKQINDIVGMAREELGKAVGMMGSAFQTLVDLLKDISMTDHFSLSKVDDITILSSGNYDVPKPGKLVDLAGENPELDKGTVEWAELDTLIEQSSEFEKLIDHLSDRLDGTNLALDDWAEDALYHQSRDNTGYREAVSQEMGAYCTFWEEPPGVLMSSIDRMRRKEMDRVMTISREITSNQMKTAADARREAVRHGITATEQAWRYNENKQNRVVQLMKYHVDYGFKAFAVEVQGFITSMNAFKVKADVLTEFYKVDTKLYEDMTGYVGDVRKLDVDRWQERYRAAYEQMKNVINEWGHNNATYSEKSKSYLDAVDMAEKLVSVLYVSSFSASNIAAQISATADATGSAGFNYSTNVSIEA